jgi:hypothetical protein
LTLARPGSWPQHRHRPHTIGSGLRILRQAIETAGTETWQQGHKRQVSLHQAKVIFAEPSKVFYW